MAVDLSKTAQASGKSRAKKPATKQSEAAARVKEKRAARVAAGDTPTTLKMVPIGEIEDGTNVRVTVDDKGIKDLTTSIRQHGMLQPIRVRPEGERYVVVVGSRRLVAARHAKLEEVPVVIEGVKEEATVAIEQLVENLQRQDLDPLDEARAFRVLIDAGTSQQQLAKLLGRSQPTISNALRLLETEPEVQEALRTGRISVAHAKAIASLPPTEQKQLASTAVEEKLSSAAVEARAREAKDRVARNAQYEKNRQESVKAAVALLTSKKVTKKTPVVVRNGGVLEDINEAGWIATEYDWREMTEAPEFECDCKAVYLDIYQGKVSPCCIDPDHLAKHREAKAEQAKKHAATAKKKVTAGRSLLVKGFVSDAHLLTADGQRAALYLLLTMDRDYQDGRLGAFVKRHNGDPELAAGRGYRADHSVVWDVILGLSDAELGKELGSHMAVALLPNVFADYGQDQDAGFRRWATEQLGLAKDLVWGSAEPQVLASDPEPAEEQEEVKTE